MTTDELAVICEQAFGRSWKARLAEGLGVYISTVNRWATGYTPISRKNALAIRSLCAQNLAREEVN